MTPKTELLHDLFNVVDFIDESQIERFGRTLEDMRNDCPICGAPLDPENWAQDCGCFAELHYGGA